MQVETFECHETASEPIEACEEAIGLMKELGLKGQEGFVTKTKSDQPARCPYRQMTADEQYVYKVLCPDEVDLKSYDKSPIPLRALQIAAHANSLGIFKRIVVWDRVSAIVKDPVLVGYMPGKEYSWQETPFILARWGAELEAFSTLVRIAYQQKREQILAGLRRSKSAVDSQIASVEAMPDDELQKLGPLADARLEIR